MSALIMTSNLLMDLSTEEQQVLTGGKKCNCSRKPKCYKKCKDKWCKYDDDDSSD